MTSNNSNYNENAEIPMEGAVHYEKEESPILENGTYSFRVLSMKREIVSPTNTMPRHTNVKFMMLLEDADGQSWKVWDNVRMYQKWLWKYAQLAKGIGMNVIAYDIFHAEGIENELGMKYVELEELFAQSDFISLHTPAINGAKLINAETIAKMKDGVVFINTSRGNNVDEDALLEALDSGKVYAAGLDVYAEEPSKNHALYSHARVSCTPHIGAATREAQKRIGAEIVSIIKESSN